MPPSSARLVALEQIDPPHIAGEARHDGFSDIRTATVSLLRTRQTSRWLGIMVLVTLMLLPWVATRAQQRVDLQSRPGVVEPIYVTDVPSPKATVILFPGGVGVIASVRNNFLIRVAPRFTAAGMTVVLFDTPSDRPTGMDRSFRLTPQHLNDITAAVTWVNNHSKAPIWLIGTSNGSISAAEGAAIGPPVHGVVLTSSVWQAGMQQTPLARITVPVLVVHNRDDGCRNAQYDGASPAMSQMQQTRVKELITVSGGSLRGDPCEALSPHGYLGIEDQVSPQIITWIIAH
jgi:pimeloyl-ACP methyl ester carboxylesterase